MSIGLAASEAILRSERKRFITQVIVIVISQVILFAVLYGITFPCFKMGEVVTDEMTEVREEIIRRGKASQQLDGEATQESAPSAAP